MKHIHSRNIVFEYSKITPYIFIGTNQCCQAHFNSKLIKKGIKADISLEEIKIDRPFGVDYYLWLPTRDHHAPTQKQLFLGTKFIKNLVDNKIKMYIHCQNGHGRDPTLVATYFLLEGKTFDKSITVIKKKRKTIYLNKKQLKGLRRFENFLKRKNRHEKI